MLVAGDDRFGKIRDNNNFVDRSVYEVSPMDLNLMLVDMKGGGFSDRLGDLPHCVGVVTDLLERKKELPRRNMLKRFLESLNAE